MPIPNTMPKTIAEWHNLVGACVSEELAKAEADPAYEPRPQAYFENLYSCYYPQPVADTPELTPAEVKAMRIAEIDAETSGAILAGFDYTVDGETFHFNYDSFDQQNFADTANACLMYKQNLLNMQDVNTVMWNGYAADGSLVRVEFGPDEFLAFYAAALYHKQLCMNEGARKKLEMEGLLPA